MADHENKEPHKAENPLREEPELTTDAEPEAIPLGPETQAIIILGIN